ncbi:hypothetical protein IEE84_00395 [Psychrobacter sp. 28M-43]|uniref:hypothetical protein n=1 Tax=Psychrobacter sp. 28M-43 TaxID=2772254 RepID=UPI00168D78E0|nr:hypothetical protein [Psychrobacter sp. 28M-43]QOD12821.1 hypothetical protein IEE84_00395 [Psychrobacter sp. 28M-43]
MKPDNIRPSSTHASKKKQTKSRQKILAILISVLLLIVIVYLIVGRSGTQSTLAIDDATSVPVTKQMQTESVTDSTSEVSDDSVINDGVLMDENSEAANNDNNAIPNPTAILDAPLPENNSLAKEEIDRLEDERQRLAEQEKLAAEQVAMNKQLTDMKAEQIALLEQQIAQLEANDSNKATVQ